MKDLTWQQVAVIALTIVGVVTVLVTGSADAGAIGIIVAAFMPSVLKGKGT